MKVLSFSYCFPAPARPSWGVFVRQRLEAVGRRATVRVVSPVPSFPLGRLGHAAAGPSEERLDRLVVYRPTFFCVPGVLKNLDARMYARSLRPWLARLVRDWQPDVLEELLEVLGETVPGGQFLWNNQEVVKLMVPDVREPWATVYTKRLAGVDVVLNGPKGAFQLGGVASLASDRSLATEATGRDQVKLRFTSAGQLHDGRLAAFLKAHLEALQSTTVGY